MPRHSSQPPYPLAEVFGYPPDNQSAEAQKVRAQRWCPFNNPSGAYCTKDKRADPLGVCSVQHGGGPVITCPVRFREDYQIISDAADFFFPDRPATSQPQMLSEVPLVDRQGKAAGNIDVVLALLDQRGYVINYGAVEVQAVYISGNVRGVFSNYMAYSDDYLDHWTTAGYPRPDYLSSSRKRLAPQLLFKGSILNQWGRKMAVAVQASFFATLPPLVEVEPAQAQIAWLIYDLLLDPALNRYRLAHIRTVYTEFVAALTAITVPDVGDEQTFVQQLQSRVGPTRLAPDPTNNPTLLAASEEVDPDQV